MLLLMQSPLSIADGDITDHPFVSHLSAGHLGLLRELSMREKEPANRFYLIRDGLVSLKTAVPGRVDARAETPVKAWFIYGTCLREECERDPALGYAIMTHVSASVLQRLQATRRRLIYLARLTTDFAESMSRVRI